VWRANDRRLDRAVAVKVLDRCALTDPAARTALQREAWALARLDHPNVPHIYDHGEHQGLPYLVLELAEGQSLESRLEDGRLPWATAAQVCAEVAAALAAAHQRGIVHRDIKPANVLLTDTGVKLVDFGISAATGDPDIDADGNLLGTPTSVAPERLAGGPVRAAGDVYSLGVMLYRALAGRLPWRAGTMLQLLLAHQHTGPAPLPSLPGLPADIAAMCLRCLAKQPDDRPGAGEVARLLTAAGDRTATSRHPAKVDTRATYLPVTRLLGRPRSAWRRRIAALASACLLLVALSWAGPGIAPPTVPALQVEQAMQVEQAIGEAPVIVVHAEPTGHATPTKKPNRPHRGDKPEKDKHKRDR